MANIVQSTAEQLMQQATETSDLFFQKAVETVEKHMGKNASEKHPELVEAVLKASTEDFRTAIWAKAHHEAAITLSDAIRAALIDKV